MMDDSSLVVEVTHRICILAGEISLLLVRLHRTPVVTSRDGFELRELPEWAYKLWRGGITKHVQVRAATALKRVQQALVQMSQGLRYDEYGVFRSTNWGSGHRLQRRQTLGYSQKNTQPHSLLTVRMKICQLQSYWHSCNESQTHLKES